ncbi:aldo/keto reductase [Lusitaniella coriacea]|uniref:aldo/keto reductase n=1 Tax=Lusitaniella coriacea TaxID=1983105 RepID=UPI003CFBB910
MEYRTLGTANFKVSCLALGGNIFGHFCEAQETAEIMAEAQNLGINFVDTADVYSEGRSEEYIGNAIRGCRKDWVVATKAGVRSGEYPGGIGRKECIQQCLDASLNRLQTDYIDLYQMHYFDPETPLDETLETLNGLVQQGKIRSFGASNYSGEKLQEAHQIAQLQNWKSFTSTQNSYNLFRREIESDVLPAVKELGIGAIIYGSLARGILSGKYRLGQVPPPESRGLASSSINADLNTTVLETIENLTAFAGERGQTLLSLAFAWLLRQDPVSTLLVGVRNIAQLRANVGAIGWKLSSAEVAEIDRIVGDLQRFEAYCLGQFPNWL